MHKGWAFVPIYSTCRRVNLHLYHITVGELAPLPHKAKVFPLAPAPVQAKHFSLLAPSPQTRVNFHPPRHSDASEPFPWPSNEGEPSPLATPSEHLNKLHQVRVSSLPLAHNEVIGHRQHIGRECWLLSCPKHMLHKQTGCWLMNKWNWGTYGTNIRCRSMAMEYGHDTPQRGTCQTQKQW